MRLNSLVSIAAASAVIAVAGCSGNSTSPVTPGVNPAGQAHATRFAMGHSTLMLPPALVARMGTPRTLNKPSFDSCPASGTLIYMSDGSLGVVNIYDSTLTMCGQLTGFAEPQGMTVHNGNLYVANTLGNGGAAGNILAFHRGATTPYKTYTDPSGPFPTGVTVLRDGTVIASNIFNPNTGVGSVSTWVPSGRFVGNFSLPNGLEIFFIANNDDQTIFADGFDTNGVSAFWSMTCPRGACANMTDLGEAMSFPGGVIDTKSHDILASDQINDTADTFEMPSLSPATFSWNSGADIDGIDSTKVFPISDVYGADAANNQVVCFQYRQSGVSPGTCGSVAGNSGGQAIGIAVDPNS